jgi:hypothetical protein
MSVEAHTTPGFGIYTCPRRHVCVAAPRIWFRKRCSKFSTENTLRRYQLLHVTQRKASKIFFSSDLLSSVLANCDVNTRIAFPTMSHLQTRNHTCQYVRPVIPARHRPFSGMLKLLHIIKNCDSYIQRSTKKKGYLYSISILQVLPGLA